MRTFADLELTIRSTQVKDGRLHFTGIANAAHVTDSFRTRFVWTDECLQRTGEVPLLWNHNPDAPIGRGNLRKDGDDLMLDGWISEGAITPYGAPVQDLMRDDTVRGLSVHFDNEAVYKRGTEFDTITPNYLPEVSVTTLPSNTGSNVVSTRAMQMARGVLGEMEKHPDMELLVGGVRAWIEDNERAWSKPRLKDFTQKAWGDLTDAEITHIKSHFLYAPADAAKFGDLKLPYKDPESGKADLQGLKAAASRLPNTEGISEADKKKIGAKIASEMKALGGEYTGEYAPGRSMGVDNRTRQGGPLDYGTLYQRLQDEIQDAYNSDPWYGPRLYALYDDFCIVEDPDEAAYYQHGYSVDGDGAVTLDPNKQAVLMTWQPVSPPASDVDDNRGFVDAFQRELQRTDNAEAGVADLFAEALRG